MAICIYGDLHCHSTFSDGSETPEDIVGYAGRFGIGCVAITDHDILDGAKRAEEAGESIKVIPGVEISTFDYKNHKKVHILCYGPKKIPELNRLISETRQNRHKASLKIIEKLRSKYPIDEEFVRRFTADSPAIFKHHIILALMHLGYANTIFGDLYRDLFSKNTGWAMVQPVYPETREALRTAVESGGICVLAHPGVYHNFDIIDELKKEGLHGIEVWHPRQTDEDTARALAAADEKGLIKTGGTDFHGSFTGRPCHLGTRTTPPAELEKLLSMLS